MFLETLIVESTINTIIYSHILLSVKSLISTLLNLPRILLFMILIVLPCDNIKSPIIFIMNISSVVFYWFISYLLKISIVICAIINNIVILITRIFMLFFSWIHWHTLALQRWWEGNRIWEIDDIVVCCIFVVIFLLRLIVTMCFIWLFTFCNYYCSMVFDSSLSSRKLWRIGLNFIYFSTISWVDFL